MALPILFEILVESNALVNTSVGGISDAALSLRNVVTAMDGRGFDRVMPGDNQQDCTTRRAKLPHNTTMEIPSSIYSRGERGCLLSISAIISPVTSGWIAT